MELPSLGTGALAVVTVVVVAMLIIVAGLFWRLWKAYSLIKDEDLPRSARVVFFLAALYTVSPIDVLPDPVLFDDIGVLIVSTGYLYQQARDLGLLPGDDEEDEAAVDGDGGLSRRTG